MSEEANRLRVMEERALVICLEAIAEGETCDKGMLDMLPAWLTTQEGTLSEQGRIVAQAIADRNECRFLFRDFHETFQAMTDRFSNRLDGEAKRLFKRRV